MTPQWFGWDLFKRQETAHRDTRLDSLRLSQTCVFVKRSALHWFLHVSVFKRSIHTHNSKGSLHATGPHCERREEEEGGPLEPSVSVFRNLIL